MPGFRAGGLVFAVGESPTRRSGGLQDPGRGLVRLLHKGGDLGVQLRAYRHVARLLHQVFRRNRLRAIGALLIAGQMPLDGIVCLVSQRC